MYIQEAEKLYHEQYSKLGFVPQPSKITGYNYDTSYPNVSINDSYSWQQLRVYFSFVQSGRFNFKTGVIAKEFRPSFDLNISVEDLDFQDTDFFKNFDFINGVSVALPLITECFLPLNDKLNIVSGIAFSLNLLFLGDREVEIPGISYPTERGQWNNVFVAKLEQERIGVSGEASVGVNYKTNFALFQLDAFYNKNMLTHNVSASYRIQNLVNTPDKTGFFDV